MLQGCQSYSGACMRDLPGSLFTTDFKHKWLDLVYRSYLKPEEKLAASVLFFTLKWNKRHSCYMTECTDYTVSRILNMNKVEAQQHIARLEELGWIWDTGMAHGARKFYIICVNLQPVELRK